MNQRLRLSYVLPLRSEHADDEDLASYVRGLGDMVDDVIVVDASPDPIHAEHRVRFGADVAVIPVATTTRMGKVGSVHVGLERAEHERVVVADDDVRWTRAQLERVVALLDRADVVRPQNAFATPEHGPLPWHAHVDSARIVLNRMLGGDWPGTLALRRSAFVAAGGYRDVMFENLELVRTLRAAGGREMVALDLIVERRPPTTRHFRSQQVRQAYDEFARPARLVASLTVFPAVAVAAGTKRWKAIAGAFACVALWAEIGRRRGGGRAVFPPTACALAAPWIVWRSLASWVALGSRLRGGVPYRGERIRPAATSSRALRRAAARSLL